jgi:3',5'-cyclic AMP phosphodiesterase CpdA
MPVFVIPGNHDDRERLRRAFADQQYLPRDGTFLHYTVEDRPLRLIGLDTVIPGEISGGMCPTRLAWLADRLAEQRERPTLIFMHHPPFPTGIRFMDTPPFAGADELKALIADHPQVRLVVCGHIHRSIHIGWAGTVAATAPSTVNQMPLALNPGERFRVTADPPAMSLYLWEGGQGVLGYTSLIEGGRPPAAAAADS